MMDNWISEPPKEAGWYWMDSDYFGYRIIEVFKRPAHDFLCISNPQCCQHTKSDYLAVSKLGAKWAGPIQPPQHKDDSDE
jgi:hypothetical protein